MAGDWIKMRADLLTHPKVFRIMSACNADKLRTIGGLFSVWCAFDCHSEDGAIEGYTPEVMDALVGFPGFSQAMISVGWMEYDGNILNLPDFTEHNGASAKRRANDTKRKQAGRMSASDADKMRTREEKRREEKKEITPITEAPPPAAPDAPTEPKGKRGTRLANGFIVPDEWKLWATEQFKGLGSGVNRIAEQFVDYWISVPGAKGVKLDWFATWRGWVRRDLERQRPAVHQQKPAPVITQMADAYQQQLQQGNLHHDADAKLW